MINRNKLLLKSLLSLYKLLLGYLTLHFPFLQKQGNYFSENKLAPNVPKFSFYVRATSNALAVQSAIFQITYSHINLDLESKSFSFRTVIDCI